MVIENFEKFKKEHSKEDLNPNNFFQKKETKIIDSTVKKVDFSLFPPDLLKLFHAKLAIEVVIPEFLILQGLIVSSVNTIKKNKMDTSKIDTSLKFGGIVKRQDNEEIQVCKIINFSKNLKEFNSVIVTFKDSDIIVTLSAAWLLAEIGRFELLKNFEIWKIVI